MVQGVLRIIQKNDRFVTVKEQLESKGVVEIWFIRFEEIPQMIRRIIKPFLLVG